MSDPLLEALRILPRFYALTAKGFSPISIRDQMVRAQMLLVRALEQGEIDRDSKVLVVGAGAAGATAAMTSASFGINTVIIDRRAQPFSRQAGCATRWIDPMQYDWPADQWMATRYSAHSPVPLPWDANLSFRIAARWRGTFFGALSPRLAFRPNTSVRGIFPVGASPPSALRVHFSDPAMNPYDFHMVVWAAGFGQEICSILDERTGALTVQHVGPAFWSTDSLETPGCGSTHAKPRVAILGAGDGGVQDLLRAVTKRKSARQIFDSLQIDPNIVNGLYNAETRAHRHWIWAGTDPRHDHVLYERLEDYHRNAARDALRSTVLDKDLVKLLKLDLDPGWLENVRLFHRCSHLTCLYGLNRFVAYLLDGFLQRRLGKPLLISNRTVLAIDKTETPHELDTVDHRLCFNPVDPSRPSMIESADVVIVRYGLDVSSVVPPLPHGLNLQRRRHSIPSDTVL